MLLELPIIVAGMGMFAAGALYLPHPVMVAIVIVFLVAVIATLPFMILLAMYRSSKIRPPPGTVWVPPPRPPGAKELPRLRDTIPFAKVVVYAAILVVPVTYASLRIAVTNWKADLVTVLVVALTWFAVRLLARKARREQ
ncbi:MAG: hypothetical protein ACRDGS_02930 [Chloroflexota bacterium]